MSTTQHSRTQPVVYRRPARLAVGLAASLTWTAFLVSGGCQKHGEQIPPMIVGPVTAFGMTLDASATPQQVAYVLLRSMRADVEAARAHKDDAQKEMFAITFSLAAYPTINQRLEEAFGAKASGERAGGSEPVFWQEKVHELINHWAPIVAYYVASFDTDYAQAAAKMKVTIGGANKTSALVLYPVCHAPEETDAELRDAVLLEIELVKTEAATGGAPYWRVARVAFRGLPASGMTATSQPTTAPHRP